MELDNCRFRAEVIGRRIAAIEKEIARPDRSPKKLAHLRYSLAQWQVQLDEAHEGITRSFLELEEARRHLDRLPVEPVRKSGERKGAGLYRMGRVEVKELA